MRKLNPGYTPLTIPKGSYPDQNQDVCIHLPFAISHHKGLNSWPNFKKL
jgi:hypothetical protein